MKNLIVFKSKKVWMFSMACLFSIGLIAQMSDPNTSDNFWDNVSFGGNIGLSFGNNFFSGTLAPSAIYHVNHQFGIGLGFAVTYNKRKYYYESTVLGGSIITLFNPIPEVQLSAEFEQSNVIRTYESDLNLANENYWYPALFVGAGYGSKNVTVGIRYDLLYDSYKSFYANPWAPFIRVYF